MSKVKSGPEIPGWAAGVAIALIVVVVLLFLVKGTSGEGPRDPSTYPKEAFSPPAYANPGGAAGYTKDGKPITR